jgi:Lysozyme like domain
VTVYTFSQLEQLWLNAGGSPTFKVLMAAVAEIESGGRSDALNPSGATGLWQIEWPLHKGITSAVTSQQALYDAQVNAQAAVALADNSFAKINSNWLVDEQPGAALALARQHGYDGPGVAGGNSTVAPPVNTLQPLPGAAGSGSSGPLADVTSAVSQAGTLLGDAAKAMDWFFHFFKPGQGWRLAFGAGAVIATYGGVRSWQSASSSDDATAALPLAVLLFALAALAGFMTLRQWPTSGGKPIVPAAYAVDILEGKPPAAGAAPASDADKIEVGLGAILAVWAASKAAQGLSGLGGLLAGLGQLFGGAAEDA